MKLFSKDSRIQTVIDSLNGKVPIDDEIEIIVKDNIEEFDLCVKGNLWWTEKSKYGPATYNESKKEIFIYYLDFNNERYSDNAKIGIIVHEIAHISNPNVKSEMGIDGICVKWGFEKEIRAARDADGSDTMHLDIPDKYGLQS